MALNEWEELELIKLYELEQQDRARKNHLDFIKHTWTKGENDPFLIGFHTRKICARIDRAMEDYRQGKSTFLCINTHPRAGKSESTSVSLPAHFLGEFPQSEIMQIACNKDLATKFTSKGREILRGPQFRELYPNIKLSQEANAKDFWKITNNYGVPTGGQMFASGIQSGIVGSGYHLGLLDDWFKGRAEAESPTLRNKIWEAFTDDMMTRRAPISITLIIGTLWHWDDIVGRLKKRITEDPGFPKFEFLTFPAKARDYKGPGKYAGEYLFLERYPKDWYESQYATMSKYSVASLLDCNPTIRTGAVLSTAGVVIEDTLPGVADLKWARIWDLAHTAKQMSKGDPDYTSGSLLAFEKRDGDPVLHLYVKHVSRKQDSAVARDQRIRECKESDGYYISQAVENSSDTKDALDYLRRELADITFHEIPVLGKGDKRARATPLEKIFETPGHVHIQRGEWNDAWMDEVIRFDGNGKDHDDQVDNLSAGYIFLIGGGILASESTASEMAARRRK